VADWDVNLVAVEPIEKSFAASDLLFNPASFCGFARVMFAPLLLSFILVAMRPSSRFRCIHTYRMLGVFD
jgi:hypothetical protein